MIRCKGGSWRGWCQKYPVYFSGLLSMKLLQISYAEEEDYERCFDDELTTMPEKDKLWRLESRKGWFRSRCCGLVEVQEDTLREKAAFTVDFLHRIVVKVLEIETTGTSTHLRQSGVKFDTILALISSSISEMKTKILS
jgi:hypothetical protein